MRNEGALGIARGAAGVDQNGRLIGQRHDRRKLGRHPAKRVKVIHVGPPGRCTHPHHATQQRAVFANLEQVGNRAFIADGQHRLAVMQPVFKRVRAEQHGQWHGHRAQLQHRHVSHCSFKALRHHDGHAVASLHTQHGQHTRQAIGLLLQLRISMKSGLSPRIHYLNSYSFSSIRQFGPARAADLGDIELVRHQPLEVTVQLRIVVSVLTDVHDESPYDGSNVPSQKNLPQRVCPDPQSVLPRTCLG